MKRALLLCSAVLMLATYAEGAPTKANGRSAQLLLNAALVDVKQLKKGLQGDIDEQLYTPESVKPECRKAALECYIKEMNVIRAELQHMGIVEGETLLTHINHFESNANGVKETMPPSAPHCVQCIKHKTKNPEGFLSGLVAFLQSIYAS
ncbi:interleukin-15-like [Lissotriton helveticus]